MTDVSNRVFVRDRAKRQMAFVLRKRNAERWPDWNWHVGITFNNHIALDFDEIPPNNEMSQVIRLLASLGLHHIAEFRTEHGSWLVSNDALDLPTYKMIYDEILKQSNNFPHLDVTHAKLSLKYEKTTLRITKKNPDALYACKIFGDYSA